MWTRGDIEVQGDIAEWAALQQRSRRKKLLIGTGLALGALLITWFASHVLSTVATGERVHDQWLKDNGCKVTKHRKGDWDYHYLGDYWEHIPGETCYTCSKTGESFCEES